MSYSPMLEREVGYLVSVADYDQIRENFAAGIPDIYTQKGQIGGATDNQTMEPVTPTADNQALVCDSSEVTGMKFNSGTVPIGTIILWSGSVGSIPNGWALCDGNNGTPDLRDRFIVGSGSSYNTGDNGGSASANLQHNHTLTTPTATGGAHTHTQSNTDIDGAHSHAISGSTDAAYNNEPTLLNAGGVTVSDYPHTHTVSGATDNSGAHSHSNPTSGSAGGHAHTLSNTGTSNGLSTSQDIRPPYYALCYIQRVS